MLRRRFIIDNDGTNLFVLKSPLTQTDLEWAVKQCPKSVTTYMVCPNVIGKFCYPCSVGEPLPRDVAPHLIDAFERGEDPFGKFLTLLKQEGKEVFITYRMNDVHNANDRNHWGISEFKRRNPELVVDPEAAKAGTGDWMSYCLDYSKRPVQDYIISSLKDIVDRYDIDGIQLDWMRFPRHLSGKNSQEIWEKRDVLTEFSRAVRNMLDQVGQIRGKRILLSARVPTWIEGCRRLGIDIKEWHEVLDFITVAPFLSCDYRIDFSEFRKLFPIKPIYAGTDMNHSGRCHNAESYRGWAMCMFDQGADGINIFNFPCWTEYLVEQPYDWIADLINEENIKNKSALYTLISNHHRVSNIDQPSDLPMEIAPKEVKEMNLLLPYKAFPVSRALFLIASNGKYLFSINGNEPLEPRKVSSTNIFLTFMDADAMRREPEVGNCYSFIVPVDQLKPGENVLSFLNVDDKPINISRVDLGTWY